MPAACTPLGMVKHCLFLFSSNPFQNGTGRQRRPRYPTCRSRKGEQMTDLITQAKGRAKRLRSHLSEIGHALSHAQSLEAISKTEGCRDWNTLSARLRQQKTQAGNIPPIQVGQRVAGTYRDSAFEGVVLGIERTDGSAKQLCPVWRIKLQFDEPVEIGKSPNLPMTRQRVRAMIAGNGRSVNLKGVPDGFLEIAL